MNVVVTVRGRRGRGLRGKAAKRRKADLGRHNHTPKHDRTKETQ